MSAVCEANVPRSAQPLGVGLSFIVIPSVFACMRSLCGVILIGTLDGAAVVNLAASTLPAIACRRVANRAASALAGFMIHANKLERATWMAHYGRK